jgi:DNA-binding PadR family transcriptional regulator
MPKVKTFLTPPEYAVLGLVSKKPAYGYELQRLLSGRHGLGLVCPVEPASVYAILKSLSGLELINGQWDNSAYPHKAIYTTTDNGDLEFQRWLTQPVARIRQIRQDFMVKLYFLLEDNPRMAHDLIEAQVEACNDYEGSLEAEFAAAAPGSFDALALSSKLSAANLTAVWLRDCLRILDRGKVGS